MTATPNKLTATIEDGFLIAKIPLNSPPVRSASGKTFAHAGPETNHPLTGWCLGSTLTVKPRT